MIVKLQRQTYPNCFSRDILIYDKKQTILTIQRLTQAQLQKIFADERKVYAKAHLEGTVIVIDKVIEDQDW